MSRVWAVMRRRMEKDTGVWKKGSWDHLVEFTSLGDLVGQLKTLNASQISKLGIVAHGNQSGLVRLDRDLTPESAPSFNSEFSDLSQYMADYGRLIFFSCKAGDSEPGTKLLNILSAIRSNRAGVDYVAIDKDRASSAALRGVVDALGVSVSFQAKQLKFMTRHELDHLARTRHHEGVVVHWNQQVVLNKCANPGCPGHSESWHFCTEFVRAIPNGPLVWP
jgi:hypothetical protein